VTQQGERQTGKQPADAPLDFEKAVEQVEGIIERIESGQIGLERSIAEYERGVALIKRCRQVLDRAEQRVEELTAQMQADAARGSGGPEERAGEGETEAPF
jgi:exodeoxyribonuclease VII small subunit